jgi:hypothetical protein
MQYFKELTFVIVNDLMIQILRLNVNDLLIQICKRSIDIYQLITTNYQLICYIL